MRFHNVQFTTIRHKFLIGCFCALMNPAHAMEAGLNNQEEFVPSFGEITSSEPLSPMQIVLVSGKRAAGKDFITDFIKEALEVRGLRVTRASLGGLNKKLFAAKHSLDFHRLEHDREYKEVYRVALVEHHGELNRIDKHWAVDTVIENGLRENADVLLISDLRTHDDLNGFLKHKYSQITLRIDASDEARESRGWKFDGEKDRIGTETDLDNYDQWTARFDNSAYDIDGNLGVSMWIDEIVIPAIEVPHSNHTNF